MVCACVVCVFVHAPRMTDDVTFNVACHSTFTNRTTMRMLPFLVCQEFITLDEGRVYPSGSFKCS